LRFSFLISIDNKENTKKRLKLAVIEVTRDTCEPLFGWMNVLKNQIKPGGGYRPRRGHMQV
jgi:hypothetical protein